MQFNEHQRRVDNADTHIELSCSIALKTMSLKCDEYIKTRVVYVNTYLNKMLYNCEGDDRHIYKKISSDGRIKLRKKILCRCVFDGQCC